RVAPGAREDAVEVERGRVRRIGQPERDEARAREREAQLRMPARDLAFQRGLAAGLARDEDEVGLRAFAQVTKPANTSEAISSATARLNTVAEPNTTTGRQPSASSFVTRNSSPMLTNARIRKYARSVFAAETPELAPPAETYSVAMTDAATKPITNFGKRSQSSRPTPRAASRPF